MNNIPGKILVLFLLLVTSCGSPQLTTPNQDHSEAQVTFQGNSQREEIQTIPINNCDGKSDATRTEERGQSIDATVSAELAFKLGSSVELITAEVQALVGAAITQGVSRNTSIQLTAPPKTQMHIQLLWTGIEQIGVVENLRGANVPIPFRGFAPTDVRILSQIDIGCASSGTPRVVITPSSTGTRPSSGGCVCQPQDCSGIRVKEGDVVPASSILEPHAGSRGILYMYNQEGKAVVAGNLWVYLDNSGNPASSACMDSQLRDFSYTQIEIVN